MIQNIPVNVINYIDAKGNLVTNQTISKIQIRSEEDLAILDKVSVGTRAYLPDESKTWVLGADEEWHQVVSGGESGGSGSDEVMYVTFTINRDNGLSINCDTEYQDMWDAINSGKKVIAFTNQGGMSAYYIMSFDVQPSLGFYFMYYPNDSFLIYWNTGWEMSAD